MKRNKALALVLVLLLLLCMAFGAQAAVSGSEAAKQGVARVRVIVSAYVTFENAGQIHLEDAGWTGSCFAVGKEGDPAQYFVTNRHVANNNYQEIAMEIAQNYSGIADLGAVTNVQIESVRCYLVLDDNSNLVPADVLTLSDRADLAVLRLNTPTTKRKPLKLRPFDDKSEINGETVYTLGYPAISDYINNSDAQEMLYSGIDQMTKTQGIVSRVVDAAQTDKGEGELIQVDASLSGGNSGGALVDENGHILGVNVSVIGSQSGNYNFAVSVNEVVRMLDEERIAYMTVKDNTVLLIGAAAVVVLFAGAAAAVIIRRRGKKPAGQGQKPGAANTSDMRHLIGESGALEGKRYRIGRGVRATIGRDPSCGIVFPEDTRGVSGQHCVVTFDGQTVTVVDTSSTCTMIDGREIPKGQPVTLHRGHRLQLGSKRECLVLRS